MALRAAKFLFYCQLWVSARSWLVRWKGNLWGLNRFFERNLWGLLHFYEIFLWGME
jgi:hypothetical protein